MKEGYAFSLWYNGRWTEPRGIIFNTIESAENSLTEVFAANARRDVRLIDLSCGGIVRHYDFDNCQYVDGRVVRKCLQNVN